MESGHGWAGNKWKGEGNTTGTGGSEFQTEFQTEFHCSVTTVPAQSHQWPHEVTAELVGTDPMWNLHLGEPQADPTALDLQMRKPLHVSAGPCSICSLPKLHRPLTVQLQEDFSLIIH